MKSSMMSCGACGQFHLADEACPFCADDGPSVATAHPLVKRFGLGLVHIGTAIGISTTMVACYGDAPCGERWGPGPCPEIQECYDDGDCEPGMSCDSSGPGSVCVPSENSCLGDADCSSGEYCDRDTYYASRGECRQADCLSDADCGSAEMCRTQPSRARMCVPRTCEADWSCPTGVCAPDDTCVELPPCTSRADCVAGTACVLAPHRSDTVRHCRPEPGPCTHDHECPDNDSCIAGACRTECYEDRGCATHLSCIDGWCAAPPEPTPCAEDAECHPWEQCAGLSAERSVDLRLAIPLTDSVGTCEPRACHRTGACAGGATCDLASGLCVPPPADAPPTCADDRECGPGERCTDGACGEPVCRHDAQCRADEVCADARCEPRRPHVAPDPDPADPVHLPGMCVLDRECAGGACIDGMCHAPCVDDGGCSVTEACLEGLCMPSPDPGSQCLLGSECGVPAVCINGFCAPSCVDDGPCRAGEFCDHGICRPDWRPIAECTATAACSDDAMCVDAQCRTPCWSAAECGNHEVCDGGYCTTPHALAPACTLSDDCEEGFVCRNGACE